MMTTDMLDMMTTDMTNKSMIDLTTFDKKNEWILKCEKLFV